MWCVRVATIMPTLGKSRSRPEEIAPQSKLGFSDLIPAIQQEGNMVRIDNACQILGT